MFFKGRTVVPHCVRKRVKYDAGAATDTSRRFKEKRKNFRRLGTPRQRTLLLNRRVAILLPSLATPTRRYARSQKHEVCIDECVFLRSLPTR